MKEQFHWSRYLILGLLLLASALSLGGCGSGSAVSASGSPDSAGQIKTVTRKSGKNEKEIMADLNASQDFFSGFDTATDHADYTPASNFVVTDLSITKRKTESKESDDVYVSLTAKSPVATYTADYELYYVYYNVGGWILDNIFMEDQNFSVDEYPTQDSVLSDFYGSYGNTYGDPVDVEVETIPDATANATVTIDQNFSHYSIQGTISMQYSFQNGNWYYQSSPHISDVLKPITGTYYSYTGTYLILETFRTEGNRQKIDFIVYTTDGGRIERYANDIAAICSEDSQDGDHTIRYIKGDRNPYMCAVFDDETSNMYSDFDRKNQLEKLSDSSAPLSDQEVIKTFQSLCSKCDIPYDDWIETAKAQYLSDAGYPVPEGYTADQYAKQVIAQLNQGGTTEMAGDIESGMEETANSPAIQDY